MHKETLVVTPSKPRGPARTAPSKTEVDAGALNHTANIHARLPSADSGIQADGGFDSLSRYRGETFLSTYTSADAADRLLGADTPDRIGSDSAIFSSQSSGGYSSNISQGPFPLKPKVGPLSSRTLVAASKPVPPLKPTLTSSPSKSGSPRPAARAAINPSLAPEANNARTLPKVKPQSSTNYDAPLGTSPGASDRLTNLNEHVPASKPVAAQRTDLGASATHRQLHPPAPPSDPPDRDPVSMLPTLQVAATDSDVELAIPKSAIYISSHTSSSDIYASVSTPARTSTVLDLDSSGDSVTAAESSSKLSIFSAPSTTLNLQVLKPVSKVRNQSEKATNQGQGCIALTRPLRLGIPSKMSVKTVHATTLSPQPPHLVPVIKASQYHEHKQQQPHQTSLSVKPKPKIAPRPSVLTKTPNSPSPNLTSNNSVTMLSGSSASTNSIKTITSQPNADTPHKPEVPVVHRIKTSGHHHERTEIPVTHVVHRSGSHKQQHFIRPTSSVGRHTPEWDRHARQQNDQHAKQPIYENIRFAATDGFDFDEAETRMKHADLILKHSDELISDALKMLVARPQSPLGHKDNGPLSSSGRWTDASTHEGGEEGRSQREHRIPIFDTRTGKIHSGSRKSYWSEWTAGHATSTKGEAVTWSERKERIDSALTWLRHELADLRDMDSRLISQFQRCQDTIETLKNQRESWEGLSEEGEEGEYWEDYELNEYNRRYLDSPGGSSCSQFSPGSRQPSLQDVTLISFPVPQAGLPQDKKTANEQHGVTQDIEVTL